MAERRASRPPLGRLIDPAALAGFLATVAGLAPGATVRIVERSSETASAPIHGDDRVLGWVEVSGGGAAGAALAAMAAAAVGLAAGEGLRRRAVAAAAIDDLRELSLLSRLAEMLGGSVDPGAIASCMLSTVSRPLAPAVGLVLGPDDGTLLATAGDDVGVARLRVAAAPLVVRLRAEDPAAGTCAEVDLDQAGDGLLGSTLIAFLRTDRGHQGTIALARRAGSAAFTEGDRRLVAAVAGQAAVAIERAGLQRRIADRQVLDHELAIGRRIQLSLMPRRFPNLPGWQIASAYEPAREVGGDFYDAFPLRDRPGRIGLVVADVTGKGIPAAILMADSRALIHAAADHGGEPADTLARVNQILVTERASGLFVTVAHAVLEGATGLLRFASAGHDPVHVLRADGSLEILDPPGRLIGMVADIAAANREIVLGAGDAWIGHTDGVTEARDAAGAFYGEERFRELLRRLAGRSAAGMVDAIAADVASFRGAAEPSDDLTLLVVRRESGAPVPV
jgi:serine phosphatase RsbU (regulator of sigma subunit)